MPGDFVVESEEEEAEEEESSYRFVRAHPHRSSNSSSTLRESFSDLMKRRLPRVFSSFRSSKRRQQVASIQSGDQFISYLPPEDKRPSFLHPSATFDNGFLFEHDEVDGKLPRNGSDCCWDGRGFVTRTELNGQEKGSLTKERGSLIAEKGSSTTEKCSLTTETQGETKNGCFLGKKMSGEHFSLTTNNYSVSSTSSATNLSSSATYSSLTTNNCPLNPSLTTTNHPLNPSLTTTNHSLTNHSPLNPSLTTNNRPTNLHYSSSFSHHPCPQTPSPCCGDHPSGLHRSNSWLPVTKIHVNGDSCPSPVQESFGRVKSRLSTKSLSLNDQNGNEVKRGEAGMRVLRLTTDEDEELEEKKVRFF